MKITVEQAPNLTSLWIVKLNGIDVTASLDKRSADIAAGGIQTVLSKLTGATVTLKSKGTYSSVTESFNEEIFKEVADAMIEADLARAKQ